MRFLIDNALSPVVAELLRTEGHDALHLYEIGMAAASDQEIMRHATAEDRIIVSADTDFGTLLAFLNSARPSVILFRKLSRRRPFIQVQILLLNLQNLTQPLQDGCVAIIDENRVRVRSLPIHRSE